jgi:hypothetical protein
VVENQSKNGGGEVSTNGSSKMTMVALFPNTNTCTRYREERHFPRIWQDGRKLTYELTPQRQIEVPKEPGAARIRKNGHHRRPVHEEMMAVVRFLLSAGESRQCDLDLCFDGKTERLDVGTIVAIRKRTDPGIRQPLARLLSVAMMETETPPPYQLAKDWVGSLPSKARAIIHGV